MTAAEDKERTFMDVQELDQLVESGDLESYKFTNENDTGNDPYQRLELIFRSGKRMVVLPEKRLDGREGLDLYFRARGGK